MAEKEKKEKRDKKEKEPKRRTRPIDAKDVFVSEDGEDPTGCTDRNAVFRKRLTYLMNGNNTMSRAVNIQELADAVGVSRPAIRKYLKPKESTTPSAQTVCSIAGFFGTTPNFLLGFDETEADTDAVRLAFESDFYNRLGLNQATIDKLRQLRAMRSDEALAVDAAALLSMLDRQIQVFAEDAVKFLEKKQDK